MRAHLLFERGIRRWSWDWRGRLLAGFPPFQRFTHKYRGVFVVVFVFTGFPPFEGLHTSIEVPAKIESIGSFWKTRLPYGIVNQTHTNMDDMLYMLLTIRIPKLICTSLDGCLVVLPPPIDLLQTYSEEVSQLRCCHHTWRCNNIFSCSKFQKNLSLQS